MNAEADDHYGVLGVPPDASPDAIRAAFRRLIRESHPDTTNRPAHDPARLIAAYRCLASAVSRERYDRERAARQSSPLVLARHSARAGRRPSRGHGLHRILAGLLVVASASAAIYVIAVQRPLDIRAMDAAPRAAGAAARGDSLRIEAGLDVHWVVTMHGREMLAPLSRQCYGVGAPRITRAQCDYCAAFDEAAERDTPTDAYFSQSAREARVARLCMS